MSTRPDVAELLQQLTDELRALSARVGRLEEKATGLVHRVAVLEHAR